ncbi:hypothetical protein [Pseudomarimonas salicorniae]|uniref:DUF998 domain-containing protein n=1 Tax=Pseudomarimonas salicorniae TaxID=2933270 RepID=A0ABT0GDH5_9GAMM|nr:hypothetical protein [Lysobacter sp. CAU 1642]MCK7592080.1 hypothetical protein [Lysobacter sp. CAU 1642]
MPSSTGTAAQLPLWPLPALCALLPVIAVHLAWWLSARDGHVPAGVPYLDGGFSISRAARHGWGNDLFKMLMLPCAALQALSWLLLQRWLRGLGASGVGAVAGLGLIAAAFLGLYAVYLGSEGEIYRTLRRYGVTVYFACTYLALLVSLRALPPEAFGLRRHWLWVALSMLALGLGSVATGALIEAPAVKDRWENLLEWQLGLWLTAMFVVWAWAWRDLRMGFLP